MKKSWELFFAWSHYLVVFEITELSVTAGTDVAFAAALMRCAGTDAGGRDVELGFRLTIGLSKGRRAVDDGP